MQPLNMETFRRMRRLSIVPRWQIMPVINRQSVLDHSVSVAYTYQALCELLQCESSDYPFQWALEHDKDEAIHGDAPSTSKKPADPRACTHLYKTILKTSDYLEALLYLKEEMAMGNGRLYLVYQDVKNKRYRPWATRMFELAEKHLPDVNAGLTPEKLLDLYLIGARVRSHPNLEK